MKQNIEIGVVLLAAGASSRMGSPKQLLPYGNQPMICHILDAIPATIKKQLVVVLGAHADEIQAILPPNIAFTQNPDWGQGMGSSISCGTDYLNSRFPSLKGIIYLTSDQPLITDELLNGLIEKFQQEEATIIACEYGGILGIPVLFGEKFFPSLISLQGQQGAKAIVQIHLEETAIVSFPGGMLDIDTPRDYQELQKML